MNMVKWLLQKCNVDKQYHELREVVVELIPCCVITNYTTNSRYAAEVWIYHWHNAMVRSADKISYTVDIHGTGPYVSLGTR